MTHIFPGIKFVKKFLNFFCIKFSDNKNMHINKPADIGIFILRTTVSIFMLSHGIPKLGMLLSGNSQNFFKSNRHRLNYIAPAVCNCRGFVSGSYYFWSFYKSGKRSIMLKYGGGFNILMRIRRKIWRRNRIGCSILGYICGADSHRRRRIFSRRAKICDKLALKHMRLKTSKRN